MATKRKNDELNEEFAESSEIRAFEETVINKINEMNLINIRDAAGIRGCTQSAIHQLIERGRLHPVKLMDHTYVKRSEVEGLEPLRTGPKPAAKSPDD